MKRVLIGCGVLRKEIEEFLKDSDIECRWLKEQLHNEPDKLHLEIQEAIDAETEAELIYLSYGLCGNALVGVQAKACPILMPRVEDCIEIILHGRNDVNALRCSSYFVSQGWLWGEDGIGYEHDRMKEKYGEKKALRIAKVMFKNYQYLLFIRTGVETEDDRRKCEAMAQKLELGMQEIEGGIQLLEELLDDARDDRYIMLEPGEAFIETMFHRY